MGEQELAYAVIGRALKDLDEYNDYDAEQFLLGYAKMSRHWFAVAGCLPLKEETIHLAVQQWRDNEIRDRRKEGRRRRKNLPCGSQFKRDGED